MKTTIEKYYDALLDLQKIGKIQNSTKFAKDRKIGARFILTCKELGLVEKRNKNYFCRFKQPSIEMAENIKKVINETNNNFYQSKTSIQPEIEFITDEQMIQHLKSKGYKIFKPFTDYQEL
jgi:hypothetical protein